MREPPSLLPQQVEDRDLRVVRPIHPPGDGLAELRQLRFGVVGQVGDDPALPVVDSNTGSRLEGPGRLSDSIGVEKV